MLSIQMSEEVLKQTMDNYYIELAQVRMPPGRITSVGNDQHKVRKFHSIRLSRALEVSLAELESKDESLDLTIRRLKIIHYLCLIALRAEMFVQGMCEDQWLRTTIFLNEPSVLSTVRIPESSDSDWHTILTGITIRSNFLPCQEYVLKLQEMTDNAESSKSKRVFFTFQILEKALQEGHSLTQQMTEWRASGRVCDLTEKLQERVQTGLATDQKRNRRKLLRIEPGDLKSVTQAESSDRQGKVFNPVSTALWQGSTFARKMFKKKEQYQKEVDILTKISHAHIVHSFAWCVDESAMFFVLMELLDEDLYAFLSRRCRLYKDEPPFKLSDSLDVLQQLSQAMKYLHEMRIIHGDLKPRNILLSSFELSDDSKVHYLIKVADFGGSRLVDSDPSASFRPLEGALSRKHLESHPECSIILESRSRYAADVYMFGLLACKILAGLAATLDTVCNRPGLNYPKHLTSLVEKCLHDEPSQCPSFSDICNNINEIRSNI